MLKNILNLGDILSKKQQQNIQGGAAYCEEGCVDLQAGDTCYYSSGNCNTAISGTCKNFGGTLGCFPL